MGTGIAICWWCMNSMYLVCLQCKHLCCSSMNKQKSISENSWLPEKKLLFLDLIGENCNALASHCERDEFMSNEND